MNSNQLNGNNDPSLQSLRNLVDLGLDAKEGLERVEGLEALRADWLPEAQDAAETREAQDATETREAQDATETRDAQGAAETREAQASFPQFAPRFHVWAASQLALPKGHKAFFACPEDIDAVTRYLALKACSFLTHTLFVAKMVTDAERPLPTPMQYDISAATIDHVVFALPALEEAEMREAAQMNERFAALRFSAPVPLLQENTSQATAQCACLAQAIRYAEALTEAVAHPLYELPEAEIYKELDIAGGDEARYDAIVFPYFDYLASALEAFRSALLQGEYPRIVAYPFALPMLAPYTSTPEEVAQLSAMTARLSNYERIHTFYCLDSTGLILWDGMRECCKVADWQDGVFVAWRV